MEQPRIQYAKTSDGVSIAVCTLGEGHPLVFLPVTNSIGIEGLWQIPGIRRNLERLAEGRRVVLYDGSGVGLSTRDVEDLSTDASERDLGCRRWSWYVDSGSVGFYFRRPVRNQLRSPPARQGPEAHSREHRLPGPRLPSSTRTP